ncbi:VanZ family protein [Streptomyces sp. NPDC047315]|uniref:VanZ family protein n=1 Tax=Streptomyces sp. NPDC047315 TaxID=3155142 RepID=UPI0033FAF821
MQRQGKGGNTAIRFRAAGGLLLLAHLLLVGWLTLRPLDVPWVAAANLELFAGIEASLALGPAEAAQRIGGALALLAPLGVLLPMAGGSLTASTLGSLVRTVAAGALISLGIELLQTGIAGRVMDVDSLLLNSAGVALAHLLVVPAARTRLRRRLLAPDARSARRKEEVVARPVPADEVAQGSTPTIPRVGIAP